ncbi:MAG TPA: ParA family protein [Burkholderiaceae bacterium]
MPVIVVANPKGGVGKSTLATQIAGFLAARGRAVTLGDLDRQQSSRQWLAVRPPQAPRIAPWEISRDSIARPAKGSTDAVVDTPAGLHGGRLDAAMKVADLVVVPMQPSLFDMQATHAFVRELRGHKRAGRVRLGLVGMRVKEHTIAQERLQEFVAALGVPLVAALRDTQNYVHLAAQGLTLFDVAPGRVERDLAQFAPLGRWLLEAGTVESLE